MTLKPYVVVPEPSALTLQPWVMTLEPYDIAPEPSVMTSNLTS